MTVHSESDDRELLDGTDLSIGIVSYNAVDALLSCLRSIIDETSEIQFEIFVVDNASSDQCADRADEIDARVVVIRNDRNLGFAKAVNQALVRARGKYFLMLNPDTTVSDRALEKSLAFLNTQSANTAISCRIVNAAGETHYVRRGRAISSIRGEFVRHMRLERIFRNTRFFRATVNDFDTDAVSEIPFTQGSFVMLPTQFMRELGGLDEQFELYAEDYDLCCRIYQSGGRILHYPDATVTHIGAQSSVGIGLIAHEQMIVNRYRFFRKHCGQWRALCFSAIWCMGAIVDMVRHGRDRLLNRHGLDPLTMARSKFTALWFCGLRKARPLPQPSGQDA